MDTAISETVPFIQAVETAKANRKPRPAWLKDYLAIIEDQGRRSQARSIPTRWRGWNSLPGRRDET